MSYPTRRDAKPTPQQRAQNERAQALTGSSGYQPGKKAVTHDDVASLGTIKLLSSHVSAAPTAADHNALVDDMRAIAAILNAMGAKFTGL